MTIISILDWLTGQVVVSTLPEELVGVDCVVWTVTTVVVVGGVLVRIN